MDMIISALSDVFVLTNLLWFVGGTALGIVAGVLPGVGASLTMALLIPITFYLDKTTGLMTLVSAWAGAVYGGSISSILINTPGTGANVATCFDGFPMARNGKARVALGISATSSMIGGLFGITVLILFSPYLSKISIMFGAAEYFLLAIFGLTVTSSTIKGSTLKGLISSGVGLMISFIGYDIITGTKRYTFHTMYLEDGIDFLIVVIGFFAVTQLFSFLSEKGSISLAGKIEGKLTEGIKLTFKHIKTALVSSVIGTIFGFAPGVGTTAASLVAYSTAESSSDHPDDFGKGIPEGIVAAEASNNAVQGGALIPTLTLGIPGNSDSAVFLAGLMMYGINPGRNLYETNSHLLYVLFIALLLAQIMFWLVGLLFTPIFAKITLVPIKILLPIIWIVACLGAFALNNEFIDCIVIIVMGVIGYLMKKLDYPTVPLLMGVILGPLAEKNFARAMMISDNSLTCFVDSSICWVIWVLIVLSIVLPKLLKARSAKKRAAKQQQ